METISKFLVGLIALEHIYILILEMFLWTKPRGRRVFGTSEQQAKDTKVMAANQGLYNGFLAIGLLWGLFHPNEFFGWQLQVFFIFCVLIAGIYGGLTAKRSILKVQALPALIALVFLFIFKI